MKRIFTALFSILLFVYIGQACIVLFADTYNQTTSMGMNATWTDSTYWTSQTTGQAGSPAAGDSAIVGNSMTFRTPGTSTTGTYSFPASLTVNTGGTVTLKNTAGAIADISNFTLNGGSIAQGNGNSVAILSGNISVTANSLFGTLGADRTIALQSNLSGTGNLTVEGAGVVSLSGTNSTYSGDWHLTAGIVRTDNTTETTGTDPRFGSGVIYLKGGGIGATVANASILNNLVAVAETTSILNGDNNVQLRGSLTGSGNLSKNGSNQVHIYGDASEFSGTITNTVSWLGLIGSQSASQKASYVSGGSGIFMRVDDEGGSGVFKMGSLTGTGGVRPGSGSKSAIELHVGYLGKDETFNGNLLNNTYNGEVIMSVVKEGNGTWTLAGANTYSGGTTVNGGVLKIAAANGIINGLTVNSGAEALFAANDGSDKITGITVNNGTLSSDLNGGYTFLLCDITLNGGTIKQYSAGHDFHGGFSLGQKGNTTGRTVTVIGDKASYISCDFDLGGTHTFNVADVTGNSDSDLIFTMNLNHQSNREPGYAVKTGTGTMELQGTNNTIYSIDIQQGKLLMNNTVGGYFGNGLKAAAGAELEFQVDGTSSLTFGQAITGVAGANLIKSGTGALTLGNCQNFLGNVSLKGGALAFSNNDWFTWHGTGFEISDNVTLDLSGAGNFNFNVDGAYLKVTQSGKTATVIDNGTANYNQRGINTVGTGHVLNISAVENSLMDIQARVYNVGILNITGQGTVNLQQLSREQTDLGPSIIANGFKLNAAGSANGIVIAKSSQEQEYNAILSPGLSDGNIGKLNVLALETGAGGQILFDVNLETQNYDQIVLDSAVSTTSLGLLDKSILLNVTGDLTQVNFKLFDLINNDLYLGDVTSLLASDFQQVWRLTGLADGIYLSVDPNLVPEPSSWIILILGLLGLGISRTRKKS